MRILHIAINAIYTEGMAYQEMVLPDVHASLGHEVHVMASCEEFNGGRLREVAPCCIELKSGVILHRVLFVNLGSHSLTYRFRIFPAMYRLIEEISPDFIMMHGFSTLSIYGLRRYMKKHPNTRLVADNHADFSNSASNWASMFFQHKIIWRHMARILVPYTEVFYGIMPARRDFLVDIYKVPKEKCQLLFLGAEDDKVRIAKKPENVVNTRKKYGIKYDEFLVVTGGKIDNAKKQTLLLMDAVSQISSESVKLLIFGDVDDELEDEFYKYVDGKRICYIGWLTSYDTYFVLAAADLAVYPGRHSILWEQTAGVGTPIVCKYWEGTTHINNDGNVEFIYEDSVETIRNIISSLACDKSKYRKMKEKAEMNKRRFSYANIAQICIADHSTSHYDEGK